MVREDTDSESTESIYFDDSYNFFMCMKNPRICKVIDCSKFAQGNTRYCIGHGGGRRCTYEGCNKTARGKIFCVSHGGGKRCSYSECTRPAIGATSFCSIHGGGKRCISDGCIKFAQAPTDFCVRHGGGRRCVVENCEKVKK